LERAHQKLKQQYELKSFIDYKNYSFCFLWVK
jgi:hypothetical protein